VMRGPVGRSRRGRPRGVGVAVMLTFLSLSGTTLFGCTSARDTLGTNSSSCYEALVIAADAVHHKGTFAGVRLLSFTKFGSDADMQTILSARAGTTVHDVCAVSYKGTFTMDQVERPLGPAPPGGVGHYAIIIVSKPQNHLLGTVLRLTQPLRFGHPV
jgi:hypothetical protein